MSLSRKPRVEGMVLRDETDTRKYDLRLLPR
jgi:hypothetical protein